MRKLLQKINYRKYALTYGILFAVLLEAAEYLFDFVLGDGDGYVTQFRLDLIITILQVVAVAIPLVALRTKSMVVINLRVLLVMLLLMEGAFWLMYEPPAKTRTQTVGDWREVGYTRNEATGYATNPNIDAHDIILLDGDTVYNAHITTDEKGRRINPANQTGNRNKYALFIGGSYTLGAGVNNNQTMQYQFAQAFPKHKTYTYCGGGWGTNHLHALFSTRNLASEIPEQEGICIYTFIDQHIDRNIGTQGISTTFGGISPYYYLNGDGELVRNKDFNVGRRRLTDFYHLLNWSNTLKYFNITFPVGLYKEPHYELTVALAKETARLYQEQFGNDNFYILIYPNSISGIGDRFKAAGLKVIDLSKLYSIADDPDTFWKYRIKNDRHPNPEGHKLVAGELKKQLAL